MNYPRPANDNRCGIHWSANIYHPEMDGDKASWWIDQLVQMGLKWCKILDDGGGSALKLFKRLIEAGIMPVVRLYRNCPNPGTIGMREQDTIRRMADIAGHVIYVETNNEPDLGVEWRDGKRPTNWMDVVAFNFIADADMVLEARGIPAFPALGPGSTAAYMLTQLRVRNRLDLFEKMWVAIHNYCGGRPLEYPNDLVHQQGQPLTQAEYDATGGMWAWEMPLEQVNAIRLKDKKPGETIMSDATCFRAFERFNADIVAVCGHSVPIMMTEGGYDTGQRFCARYAKPTPQRMSDLTLRMMKFMAREETIDYEPGAGNKGCPDYYFASMPWLIAAFQMGHDAPHWEVASWFTDWYNKDFGLKGQLPIVDMLKSWATGGAGGLPPVSLPEPVPPPPAPIVFPEIEWDPQLNRLNVKLIKADANVAAWRLVSAKWFNVEESKGNCHVYFKAKKDGQFIEGQKAILTWRMGLASAFTKGAVDNYLGNFPMFNGLGSYDFGLDPLEQSDCVTGLGLGSVYPVTNFDHTSFELIFEWQEAVMPPVSEPPPAIVWGNIILDQYHDIVLKYCGKVDPKIIGAIIWLESQGLPLALGESGEIGLMQIMRLAGRPSITELYNVDINIKTGCEMLQSELLFFKNDLAPALVAYNRGRPKAIAEGIGVPKARFYLDRFCDAWRELWQSEPPIGVAAGSDWHKRIVDIRWNAEEAVRDIEHQISVGRAISLDEENKRLELIRRRLLDNVIAPAYELEKQL